MAVGLNADTDWANRTTNIGSVGHTDITLAGWFYRISAGQTFSTIQNKRLMGVGHGSNGRGLGLTLDTNFSSGTINDPRLAISNTQTGSTAFASSPAFDTWFFAYLRCGDNAGTRTVWAEWSTDGSTWVSHSQVNGVESSVQAEQVLLGRWPVGETNTMVGHYAYFEAFGSDLGQTNARALFHKTATDASEWGFWPLADNTDTGDDSGNGRTLTFNGTLTTETSPVNPPDGIGGGRTTRNTRSHRLGLRLGMGHRIAA